MSRMLVDRESFTMVPGDARRLTGYDVRQINRLYRIDGTPAFYTAQNIDDAVYYGVLDGERLVSVAGTHVVSGDEGLAVVGNVFTHPRYRGFGFGTLVTGAVTRDLLEGPVRDVVLSVDPRNRPAVRAYEKLGFREVGKLIEGAATRRDLGLMTWLRRGMAAIRGRSYGAEAVSIRL
jgi:ribosomal protein S18 acetylase RimI-like enzyme